MSRFVADKTDEGVSADVQVILPYAPELAYTQSIPTHLTEVHSSCVDAWYGGKNGMSKSIIMKLMKTVATVMDQLLAYFRPIHCTSTNSVQAYLWVSKEPRPHIEFESGTSNNAAN